MTQQNQADQGWGSERRLWNALKRQDFPVLDFPGRATGAPCWGEERKNATAGPKDGGSVYNEWDLEV
jgi:hypothetical protein